MLITKLSPLLIALSLGLNLAHATDKKDASADPAVKKSDSGICHEKGSASYGNTKKFTAFASVDEGVKSGGKLPGAK